MTNPHGHQYPQQPGGYSHYGSGPHGYQHGGPQQGPQPGQPFAQPSPYYSMPQNDKSGTGCLAWLIALTALLPVVLGIIAILVLVGGVYFAMMVSESGETSSTTTSSSVTITSTAATPTAATTRPTAPGGDSSFEPPEPSGSPGYIR